jgi:hypothetical protein
VAAGAAPSCRRCADPTGARLFLDGAT